MSVARKLLFCALLSFASQAPAQQGGDLQAQILYAYQTEDANALANLIQDLSTQVNADAADPALRYHLAHALYRRGLLAAGGNAHEADVAFAGCVDQLKPVLSQDAKSVESLLLQSACYAGLADLRRSSRCCFVRGRRSGSGPRSSWRRAIRGPCSFPARRD